MLSLLEAMNSGRHNARSGVQTAGHADAVRVLGKIDLAQRNSVRGQVDDPNEAFAILGEDGRFGHAQNWALVGREPCGDGRSKPEGWRRIIQGNTDALRTRHRIGLRRNLTNLAFNVNAGKNLQADRKGQADPQRDRKVRPDIDDGLSDVWPCDGDDGLTG